jgi:hypothetical protein
MCRRSRLEIVERDACKASVRWKPIQERHSGGDSTRRRCCFEDKKRREDGLVLSCHFEALHDSNQDLRETKISRTAGPAGRPGGARAREGQKKDILVAIGV